MKLLNRFDQSYESVMTVETVASNTAADTTACSFNVPANTLVAGDQIRVFSWGNTDNTTTAGTLTLWVKVGTAKIVTCTITTTTTAKTTQPWQFETVLTFRTVGSTGTIVGASTINSTAPATTGPFMTVQSTTTAVATNAALSISFGFTWSAAVSGNIARCETASLRIV